MEQKEETPYVLLKEGDKETKLTLEEAKQYIKKGFECPNNWQKYRAYYDEYHKTHPDSSFRPLMISHIIAYLQEVMKQEGDLPFFTYSPLKEVKFFPPDIGDFDVFDKYYRLQGNMARDMIVVGETKAVALTIV